MVLLVRRAKKARWGLRDHQASSLMISAYLAPQLGEKRGTEGTLGQEVKRVSQEVAGSLAQALQALRVLRDIQAFRGQKGTVLGDHLVPLGLKDLLVQDLRGGQVLRVLRVLLDLRVPFLSQVPTDSPSVSLDHRAHRAPQDLQALVVHLLGCESCRLIRA